MPVLGFAEALHVVQQQAAIAASNLGPSPPPTDLVNLEDAHLRVLAEPIGADRDQPPFDRATRDGFAVHSESLATSEAFRLRVVGEVRAGEQWSGPELQRDQAIAIMTGAPMPPGADAVLMVEHADRTGDTLSPANGRTLQFGENVVPRGAEARAGDPVLRPGTPIGAAEVALLATCGRSTAEVFRRPSVAIIATGDELVELSELPEGWQIRNSNSYALAAMVSAAGGRTERLPIARDCREQIRESITRARQCDLVLLSGGVSMGKYDLVEEVLAEFGSEFFFTGVRMQPGKPVVFGHLPASSDAPSRTFFGLPGNPISTQVTFHCFVEPLLRVLRGEPWTGPRFVQATLSSDASGKPGLTRVLPARLTPGLDRTQVRVIGWQGSGDLAANAQANAYVVLPEGRDAIPAGEVVTVLLR